jgi:hypothetical protein
MRKNVLLSLLFVIAGTSLFFSCADLPAFVPSETPGGSENPASFSPSTAGDASATIARRAPPRAASAKAKQSDQLEGPELLKRVERPVLPVLEGAVSPTVGKSLLGRGQTDAERLAAFLLMENSEADPEFVKQLSLLYVDEAALEGIDHDVAFAQMCLETGFLRYGGLVTGDMNNFCGLGAIDQEKPGEWFSSPQIGVRAQIQHLKGYATMDPPSQELVDPRYKYVRYGSATTIEGLAGTWATDQLYADKIVAIINRIYGLENKDSPPEIAATTAEDDAEGLVVEQNL